MTNFDNPREVQTEPELMLARRAFAVAQEAFAGATQRVAEAAALISWHGDSEHPETGAVALAATGSDLVGEIVKVTRAAPLQRRAVYLYVVGSAELEAGVTLSLSRRAFLALGLLALEDLTASIEVVA